MKETGTASSHGADDRAKPSSAAAEREKRPFAEPKLTFMAPKLVKEGGLADLTFSGAFSPPPEVPD
jgi:hypothetical protein